MYVFVVDFGDLEENNVTFSDFLQGSFERGISIVRTEYSIVVQSRSHVHDLLKGRVWMAHYAPHVSVYVPMYATQSAIPPPYMKGSLYEFTRESAYWAFATVGNWGEKWFRYTFPEIKALCQKYENKTFASIVRSCCYVYMTHIHGGGE